MITMNDLMLAVKARDTLRVDDILAQTIDINCRDEFGCTALIVAAYLSEEQIVRKLLEHGANPNLSDNIGSTALCYSLHVRGPKALKERIATVLLSFGARHTAYSASMLSDLAELRKLLDNGWDINASCKDDCNSSMLILAGWRGDLAAIKMLVGMGADLSTRNDVGTNAVSAAAATGKYECTQYLIECGSDSNSIYEGSTVLYEAAKRGWTQLVELLIARGANINHNNFMGTALTAAVGRRHFETAVRLLQLGADPTIWCEDRGDSLRVAAWKAPPKFTRALLKAGAASGTMDPITLVARDDELYPWHREGRAPRRLPHGSALAEARRKRRKCLLRLYARFKSGKLR